MIDVYAVNFFEPPSHDVVDSLLKVIDSDKKARIERFVRSDDAIRSLLADVLVRFIVCLKLRWKNSEVKFSTAVQGKPYLLNCDDFHFNVSHSGSWVACACDAQPVGIDIELIQPIDYSIAEYCFSPKEYRALMQEPESRRLWHFYNIWTLKESYVKALGVGVGLNLQLNSFSFEFKGEQIDFEYSGQGDTSCYFKQYLIDPSYTLSVAAAHNNFAASVVVMSVRELRLAADALLRV